MLDSTAFILSSTSSSKASSSPGSMKSAMLSLAWNRLRAASTRWRIFTDTGVPSSESEAFMAEGDCINMGACYQ